MASLLRLHYTACRGVSEFAPFVFIEGLLQQLVDFSLFSHWAVCNDWKRHQILIIFPPHFKLLQVVVNRVPSVSIDPYAQQSFVSCFSDRKIHLEVNKIHRWQKSWLLYDYNTGPSSSDVQRCHLQRRNKYQLQSLHLGVKRLQFYGMYFWGVKTSNC